MAELVLPISHIGPGGSGGPGSEPASTAETSPLRGPKIEPAPMIPPEIEMSEEAERRLVNYLDHELRAAEMERWDLVRRWALIKRKYIAPFPETPKDFPILNSSQITIPVIKTAVNSITARMFQTVMAAEPLVSIRTDDQELQDMVFSYERFLDIYSEQKLDMEELLDPYITEFVMLGTGILEPTTLLDRRNTMQYDPSTNEYVKEARDVYSGPIVYHVPLEDFWIRPAFTSIQKAPWCGKEIRPSWSEIKDMALSGELNPDRIDTIWNRRISEGEVPVTVTSQEKTAKFQPIDRDQFRIHELAVRWDVDGDGIDEELIVYYHMDSRTLLRRKFNGFRHGRRPWVKAAFVTIPHWFYGDGVGQMLEHLQEEISTIHNQRIDNATISNLKIILTRSLIQGLRPGDRLWTGKIVKVPQDVRTDVGTLQLGEIYPNTVTNEQVARGYVQEVSGAGDVVTGQARPVSRTTAAAQLALLEELNRRFDKPMKHVRRALRQTYNNLNDLFFQMGTNGLAEEWLGTEKGRKLEEFLRLPQDYISRRMKIRITATRAAVNREVEFQTHIAMLQLIQQIGQQVLGLTQQFAPQAIGVIAHEWVKALRIEFKKVMQFGDATDPDTAVSVLAVLERILPAPENLGGMGAAQQDERLAAVRDQLERAVSGQQGNGGEPTDNAGIRRVEAILASLGQPQPGGERLPPRR